MDRQIILNHNKIYENLEKKRKKIKTIGIGLDFIDFFINEIKDIDFLDSSKDCDDISTIRIFDPKKIDFIIVKSSKKRFQQHLQYIYRQFLHENYFNNFHWYNKFSIAIENLLKKEFCYDSSKAISLVIRFVSEAFIVFSKGNNEFNYFDLIKYLENKFLLIKMNEVEFFSKKLIDVLIEQKLVFFKYKVVKIFKSDIVYLSDPFMDIIFNLNSLFIARIFSNDNDKAEIQYDSKLELNLIDEKN